MTRCSGPCSWRLLPERRTVLPSIATTSRSTLLVKDCAHRAKQPSNASGSISMKTRRNVSCEGIPFGRAKKVFSHANLLRPLEFDVFPAFRAGDHPPPRDHENVDQPMIAPARHPRIDEPVETRRQLFDHTARLPSPR